MPVRAFAILASVALVAASCSSVDGEDSVNSTQAPATIADAPPEVPPSSTTAPTPPPSTTTTSLAPTAQEVCSELAGLPFPTRSAVAEDEATIVEGTCPQLIEDLDTLSGIVAFSSAMSPLRGGVGQSAVVWQNSNDRCDVHSLAIENPHSFPIRLSIVSYQYVENPDGAAVFNGFVTDTLAPGQVFSFDMPLKQNPNAGGCGASFQAIVVTDSTASDVVDGSLEEYPAADTTGDDLSLVLDRLHSLSGELVDTPNRYGTVYDVRSSDYVTYTSGTETPDYLPFQEICGMRIADEGIAAVTYLVEMEPGAAIVFALLRRSPDDGAWRFLAEPSQPRPVSQGCDVFNPADPRIPSVHS